MSATGLGSIIIEEDSEEGPQRRSAGAHDRNITFSNASRENIEGLPGFVDCSSFDADEENCAGYTRADHAVRHD
jgi:hypothetical protein